MDTYYSVASAFNCDHFKSMDNGMDTRRGNQNKSIDAYSNISSTSSALFCHSSCFCSAVSRVASGAMTSESTSTENPVSSYTQLDTSTSNYSSEYRTKSTEDFHYGGINRDAVDECIGSAASVFDSSKSRLTDASDDGRIIRATSTDSRVVSDITVMLDESSEEFFTDAAVMIDIEDELGGHCKYTFTQDSLDSLLRKSSSTSELVARTHCRYTAMSKSSMIGL